MISKPLTVSMPGVRKIGLTYSLFVQDVAQALITTAPLTSQDIGYIEIQNPFSMQFSITRNTHAGSNIGSIRVYNLAPQTYSRIFQPLLYTGKGKQVQLQAGYQGNNPVIFNGQLQEAWSQREGESFVTQIDAFDSGFAYASAWSDETFVKKTPIKSIVRTLIKDLPGVSLGIIGDSVTGELQKGISLSGPTTKILDELTNGSFFIDGGKGHVLSDNEVIQGVVPRLDVATGLLGTPRMEGGTYITVDMLFEPGILIGQLITLNSITAPRYNGVYKVVGIRHAGMISDSVCGDSITTVQLLNSSNNLNLQSGQ